MTTNVFNIVDSANAATITVMYNGQFFDSFNKADTDHVTHKGKNHTSLSVQEYLWDTYSAHSKEVYLWQLNGVDLNPQPTGEKAIIMMTEPMRQAVHPDLTSDMFDKPEFSMESVDKLLDISEAIIVDETTGEVLEPTIQEQPLNINPLIEMIKQPEAEASAPTVETTQQTQTAEAPKAEATTPQPTVEKGPSIPKKAMHISALGLGYGVRGICTPLHFGLQSAADILQALADGVAVSEVYIIDKLGVLPTQIELEDGSFIPLTKELAQLSIKIRTKVLQNYATMPVQAIKLIIASRKTENKSTAPIPAV